MRHYGVVSSSVFVFVLFTIFTNLSGANSQTTECSRRCIAEDCDRASIRYGKYCGLGYSGCAGEKPCDDADACCQIHDDCVAKHGMMNVSCHKRFKRCIKRVAKTGKPGFSKDCPYDVALGTMLNGMDMAILLGDMGLKLEL